MNYYKHAAGFSIHLLLKDMAVPSILSLEATQVSVFIGNLTVFVVNVKPAFITIKTPSVSLLVRC